MTAARTHTGGDVGKDWLDVCLPDGRKERVRNTRSCRTRLIGKAARLGTIVCFEATDSYEGPLADECFARAFSRFRMPIFPMLISSASFRPKASVRKSSRRVASP